jgi:hypothetical protein
MIAKEMPSAEQAYAQKLATIRRNGQDDGYVSATPKQLTRWSTEEQAEYDAGWIRGAEMAERQRKHMTDAEYYGV